MSRVQVIDYQFVLFHLDDIVVRFKVDYRFQFVRKLLGLPLHYETNHELYRGQWRSDNAVVLKEEKRKREETATFLHGLRQFWNDRYGVENGRQVFDMGGIECPECACPGAIVESPLDNFEPTLTCKGCGHVEKKTPQWFKDVARFHMARLNTGVLEEEKPFEIPEEVRQLFLASGKD